MMRSLSVRSTALGRRLVGPAVVRRFSSFSSRSAEFRGGRMAGGSVGEGNHDADENMTMDDMREDFLESFLEDLKADTNFDSFVQEPGDQIDFFGGDGSQEEFMAQTQSKTVYREEYLLHKLTENLPPQFQKLKGNVPPINIAPMKGFLALKGRERELYELHLSDPETWGPTELGKKYGITRERAVAVVMLQKIHDEREARGEYEEVDITMNEYMLDMSDYPSFQKFIDGEGHDEEQAVGEEEAADAGSEAPQATDEPAAPSNSEDAVEEPEASEEPEGKEEEEDPDRLTREELNELLKDHGPEQQRWIMEGLPQEDPNEDPLARVRRRKLEYVKLLADVDKNGPDRYGNDRHDLGLPVDHDGFREPSQKQMAYFEKYGYFPFEVEKNAQRRIDEARSRTNRGVTWLGDTEMVEDVVAEMERKYPLRERDPVPPKPFVEPAHKVSKSTNFKPGSRQKRKIIFQDISATKPKVKVLDHDGTLREAHENELLHRHEIHNSGRQARKHK